MEAKTTINNGINKMLQNIDYWKKGKLWNKSNIKKETKEWFKLLK